MLKTCEPLSGLTVGSSTEGKLTNNIGRSATRPPASSEWAAAISAGGGVMIAVGIRGSVTPCFRSISGFKRR